MPQDKYYCTACHKTFTDPYISSDCYEHFGSLSYLTTNVCPHCHDELFIQLLRCDCCGRPIEYNYDDTYIETINGEIYCGDCYTIKNTDDI